MKKLTIISGPCAIENEDTPLLIAEKLKKLSLLLDFNLIFKGSVKKANRTKLDSFTGIDEDEALRILEKVKTEFEIPVTTDIHESADAEKYASVADCLQIPAFLCRQTDLLIAAGNTHKAVSIKKAQFASAESMKFAVDKVRSTGNENIMLIERGTFFGYQDLVVDFRNIPLLKKIGFPVIVDCTHSLQKPNQSEGVTGGSPVFIKTIANAAMATGADGLFLEVHPEPSKAKSDGANMLPLEHLEEVLKKAKDIFNLMNED
ncbi:MAG: 3-deoxy-8-phosphooctulonate synthase [Chitinophagaceae bacterium]|nr:MAG: 3-deoxy-8-phosphooctulonate synthase [Chitinophagaceae bacterium]